MKWLRNSLPASTHGVPAMFFYYRLSSYIHTHTHTCTHAHTHTHTHMRTHTHTHTHTPHAHAHHTHTDLWPSSITHIPLVTSGDSLNSILYPLVFATGVVCYYIFVPSPNLVITIQAVTMVTCMARAGLYMEIRRHSSAGCVGRLESKSSVGARCSYNLKCNLHSSTVNLFIPLH